MIAVKYTVTNPCKLFLTGNKAIKISQAFHDIARFEHFTDVNLYKICVQSHSKLGNGCVTILFSGAYFLLAVTVEGDESSRLRKTSRQFWPATGYY